MMRDHRENQPQRDTETQRRRSAFFLCVVSDLCVCFRLCVSVSLWPVLSVFRASLCRHFEIATLEPGFTMDEEIGRLGRELKLPPWEEPHRANIEKTLPKVRD